MPAANLIYARLKSIPAIVDIVDDRIHPLNSDEQESFPRIIYEIQEEEEQRHYKGKVGETKATLQVVCSARTYDAAQALGNLVKAALNHRDQGTPWIDDS